MNREKLSEECLNLLKQILDEAFETSDRTNFQTDFIYRHARNVYMLGLDVLNFEREGRNYSTPIIFRTMLESLFKLAASTKKPEFAIEIFIWEKENEAQKILKWMRHESAGKTDLKLQKISDNILALAKEMRCKHSVTKKLSRNTLECAKAAQLDDQYVRNYFLYSQFTHATINGIQTQELTSEKGHHFLNLTSIVMYTIRFCAEALKTEKPQKYIDESKKLAEAAKKLLNEGAFGAVP